MNAPSIPESVFKFRRETGMTSSQAAPNASSSSTGPNPFVCFVCFVVKKPASTCLKSVFNCG